MVQCNLWTAELLDSMSQVTRLLPRLPCPPFLSSPAIIFSSSSTWSEALADLAYDALQRMQNSSESLVTSAHLLTTALQLNWRVGRTSSV
jgi:hypothetical protein